MAYVTLEFLQLRRLANWLITVPAEDMDVEMLLETRRLQRSYVQRLRDLREGRGIDRRRGGSSKLLTKIRDRIQRGGQIIMVDPSGATLQFHQSANDMTTQQAIDTVKYYYARGYKLILLTSDVASQLAQQRITVSAPPPTYVPVNYHTIYLTGGKNVPMMPPLGVQPPPNPGMNNTVNAMRGAANFLNGLMND